MKYHNLALKKIINNYFYLYNPSFLDIIDAIMLLSMYAKQKGGDK